MARAYQIKSDGKQRLFWCPNCDEWYSTDELSSGTYYRGSEYYAEFDGESYYNEYYGDELYSCDNCGEVISCDEAPKMKQAGGWKCGACGSTYDEQSEAQDCCL